MVWFTEISLKLCSNHRTRILRKFKSYSASDWKQSFCGSLDTETNTLRTLWTRRSLRRPLCAACLQPNAFSTHACPHYWLLPTLYLPALALWKLPPFCPSNGGHQFEQSNEFLCDPTFLCWTSSKFVLLWSVSFSSGTLSSFPYFIVSCSYSLMTE